MRRVILTLLLAMASSSAMAEWTETESNDEFTAYASFSSIRKTGDTVKMWTLYSYSIPHELDENTYTSSKALYEFDCKTNQARMQAFSIHSGKMGDGNVLYHDTAIGGWEPLMAGSANEARWQALCRIR